MSSISPGSSPRKAFGARLRAMRARLEEVRASEAAEDERRDAEFEAETGTAVTRAEEAQQEREAPAHPVPPAIRAAAEWAWRLLAIVVAVGVFVALIWRLRVVIFPVVIAVLLAAGLQPLVARLRRRGLGAALSTAIVFVGFLVIVVGGLSLAGNSLQNGFSDVSSQAQDGIKEIRDWLVTGPLHVKQSQLDDLVTKAQDALRNNSDRLTSGAITTATVAVEVITGALLALFTLFFLLYDGEQIWHWIVRLFPRRIEPRVNGAGDQAWRTLKGYVRGTFLVALFDGIFITIVLLVLRVPLAVPLGTLVFFGAFVPVVGAFITGILAVLVALVTQGVFVALLVLAGIVAVQQLESHIFQPLVLGRLVRLHPLAVVLAIAGGALVAGILGAIVAVPVTAVTNVVVKYLVSGEEPHGTPVVSAGP